MNQQEILNWYDSLSYEDQRAFIKELSPFTKHPPAILLIDAKELNKIVSCLSYCDKNKIPYKTAKSGGKIKFIFSSLEIRNQVWFGILTLIGG